MVLVQEVPIPGFEKVIEVIDPSIGLHGFIAIHSTTCGPALGGLRIFPYGSRDEALNDVLNLAQGMTSKSAVAGVKFGGGKSVIMGDPRSIDKAPLLLAFAEAINELEGKYIVAEDMGTTPMDMEVLQTKSKYVAALCQDTSSGDPSRFTAWGIFKGVQAVAEALWDSSSLVGKIVAIQGLGSVGSKLAEHLFWHGARLIISDTDPVKAHEIGRLYKAEVVDPSKILFADCDILAPCAIGGILNDESIPLLRCKGIAGGANNQLREPKNGLDLMKRGILYAPDFVINAGGLISAAGEFDVGGPNPIVTRDKVNAIGPLLRSIFTFAALESRSPSQIVDALVDQKLKYGQHK
jgi:leucine dehydrogenase